MYNLDVKKTYNNYTVIPQSLNSQSVNGWTQHFDISLTDSPNGKGQDSVISCLMVQLCFTFTAVIL